MHGSHHLWLAATVAMVGAAAVPRTVHALPPCTSISTALLTGYSCQIGGLIFDNFSHELHASSSGLATRSVPSAYDLLFGWTGNTVTLTYRPIGSAVIAASAESDPDNLGQSAEALAFARFEFDLRVDPSVPSASLLAAAGWFGSAASGAATSGSVWAYGRSSAIGSLTAIEGWNWYGAQGQESTVAGSRGIPNNFTAGFNFCGGSTISNNPVQTGDVLCGSFGSGSMLHFRTQNSAEAWMIPDPYYTSASSWASTDAAWSTTFETSLYATAVPEPGTLVLLATGLLALAATRWIRR